MAKISDKEIFIFLRFSSLIVGALFLSLFSFAATYVNALIYGQGLWGTFDSLVLHVNGVFSVCLSLLLFFWSLSLIKIPRALDEQNKRKNKILDLASLSSYLAPVFLVCRLWPASFYPDSSPKFIYICVVLSLLCWWVGLAYWAVEGVRIMTAQNRQNT